jgi:hypothetical protein
MRRLEAHLQDATLTLGERMVQAAWMAMHLHLQQEMSIDEYRRQVGAGGAGRDPVTEDVPSIQTAPNATAGAGDAEGAA